MTANTKTKEKKVDRTPAMKRVNTRILPEHDAFIKKLVEKSKGTKSEGEIHRALLTLGIQAFKEVNSK